MEESNINSTEQPRQISILVPCYNESEVFPFLREKLIELKESIRSRFGLQTEIVLVDDGSRDDTWSKIDEFAGTHDNVVGVRLSRNFGHQIAITCGYDICRGDAIVCMDADLQDPPEAVLQMIEKWLDGSDIVYGIRLERDGESAFKKITAKYFYRFFQIFSQTSAPLDVGDFRLTSRRANEALKSMREAHRYVRGMVGWLGFEVSEIYYHRQARAAGTTKYPLLKMIRFALDGIVSFSFFPLRLTYISAALASLIVFVYLLLVLLRFMYFDGKLIPGWTSLILTATIFGALNLICIGILGEYVGRIYEQVKNRPLYFIRDKVRKK